MEIAKKKIEITIDGVKHILKAPKALDSANFVDSISEESKATSTEKIIKTQEYLVKMGLPKDVCEDLEIEQLTAVIDFISKKK